ncbi:hypothetical protein PanWU01x14_328910 [Parasponia andersonii]|uniref:Uncharacterized protein n=1 Tax=Parasponia andersonii TaxID=3476 RepID=A0A2P5AII5_PARAD|nr:hypothetical protein PanWU01x14_328910 [Parasponia andersonii]
MTLDDPKLFDSRLDQWSELLVEEVVATEEVLTVEEVSALEVLVVVVWPEGWWLSHWSLVQS